MSSRLAKDYISLMASADAVAHEYIRSTKRGNEGCDKMGKITSKRDSGNKGRRKERSLYAHQGEQPEAHPAGAPPPHDGRRKQGAKEAQSEIVPPQQTERVAEFSLEQEAMTELIAYMNRRGLEIGIVGESLRRPSPTSVASFESLKQAQALAERLQHDAKEYIQRRVDETAKAQVSIVSNAPGRTSLRGGLPDEGKDAAEPNGLCKDADGALDAALVADALYLALRRWDAAGRELLAGGRGKLCPIRGPIAIPARAELHCRRVPALTGVRPWRS